MNTVYKKNLSGSSPSSFKFKCELRLHFRHMQKGLSELWYSHHPTDYAKKFRTDSRYLGRYFRGNLDRDKAESTQLPEKHNTWEIFAKKLRARSNSFRRHFFRTTSKVSIPKDRSPIPLTLLSCFSRSIVETTELLSYFG